MGVKLTALTVGNVMKLIIRKLELLYKSHCYNKRFKQIALFLRAVIQILKLKTDWSSKFLLLWKTDFFVSLTDCSQITTTACFWINL